MGLAKRYTAIMTDPMTLYIYDHCPYCTKARMIFGLKQIRLNLQILLNDDEETPIKMVGQKMVPILELEPGQYMGESLDIIARIDRTLDAPVLVGTQNPGLDEWLAKTAGVMYRLCMPRWVDAPLEEFATDSAKAYFTKKKEAMIGPFADELGKSDDYIQMITMALKVLAPHIQSATAVNGTLSYDDIHLFAALRSLSIVKGIDYPAEVESYRHAMARASGVNLHDDIAR